MKRARLAATAGLAACLMASACSGSSKAATATTTTTTTTTTTSTTLATSVATPAPRTTVATTVPGRPVWPLTGLPITDPTGAARPALVVKIDNHPQARPQTGLNQADVVYEEIVEGITRFFAVFDSTPSNPVGPIRSARTTDIALLPEFGFPIFAWSGANKGTIAALGRAGVAVDANATGHYEVGGYYRDPSRHSPHNLYTTTTKLWDSFTPPEAEPPPPLFHFRPSGTAAAVTPVVGAKLTMDGTRVAWQWDPQLSGWRRSTDDRPHTDSAGVPVAPANVVIEFVNYGRSAADPISPEAQTTGSGTAWVLTGGGVIPGRWTRPDPSKPAALTDAAGHEITLTPGRTWVELSREGGAVLVPAGSDPATVAYPPG